MVDWSPWVSPIERTIIGVAIDIILEQGNRITVYDGQEDAIIASTDKDEIIEAIAATDVTVFTITDHKNIVLGWLTWVHGNNKDVLSDASAGSYITELIEAIVEQVNEQA